MDKYLRDPAKVRELWKEYILTPEGERIKFHPYSKSYPLFKSWVRNEKGLPEVKPALYWMMRNKEDGE